MPTLTEVIQAWEETTLLNRMVMSVRLLYLHGLLPEREKNKVLARIQARYRKEVQPDDN